MLKRREFIGLIFLLILWCVPATFSQRQATIDRVGGKNVVAVEIVDSNGNQVTAWDEDHQVVIDDSHQHLHDGDHYFYRDALSIGAASQTYLITTPNDATIEQHILFAFDFLLQTTLTFHEGGDRVGTTPQTIFNNNRRSSNTTTTTIHKGTSGGTADGTLLHTYHSGTATANPARSDVGGAVRSEAEMILKNNTKYLLTITSAEAGNLINIVINFYEKTAD